MSRSDQHDEPGPSHEPQDDHPRAPQPRPGALATPPEPPSLDVKVVANPGGEAETAAPRFRRPSPTQELLPVEEDLALDMDRDRPRKRPSTGRHVHIIGTEPGFPDVHPPAFAAEPDPDFDEAEDLPAILHERSSRSWSCRLPLAVPDAWFVAQ